VWHAFLWSLTLSWHNSKVHALDGHSLALFMAQYLIDALKDLADHDQKDAETLLAALKKEDDEIHQSFANAELPESISNFYKKPKEGQYDPGIDNSLFFKGPSICRTGRLPAKSRYLGYMTNNGKTGDIAPYTQEAYDTGISEGTAKSTASETNDEMRLVFAADARERDRKCTTQVLKPDYKDFYYSHANDGLTKLVFPNEAEKKAYRYDSSSFKGLLMIFFAACDWGKCPANDLRETDVWKGDGQDENAGSLEMFVNGKEVVSLANVGSGAFLLVGEHGVYWTASSNGDYEIGARAKRPDSVVRLSAVVLY
jgi:hypothetical protein